MIMMMMMTYELIGSLSLISVMVIVNSAVEESGGWKIPMMKMS